MSCLKYAWINQDILLKNKKLVRRTDAQKIECVTTTQNNNILN